MKKIILLLTVFGILNFIAWNFFGLLFIASVSILFYILDRIKGEDTTSQLYKLFSVALVLNFSVSFWLFGISWWEGLLAVGANSIVMSIPLILILILYQKTKNILFPFIICWVIFEFLHTKWDFSWPWLTFGHVMGNQYYLVQWYSVGGVYSGSLWLIITGYLLFKALQTSFSEKRIAIKFGVSVVGPLLLSLTLFFNENELEDKRTEIKVTVYNPSLIDFKGNSNYTRLKNLHKDLAQTKPGKFLITPEIFLSKSNYGFWADDYESVHIKDILEENPETTMVLGTELENNLSQKFNTVIFVNKKGALTRTKKKYIPLREFTPAYLGKTYYTKNIRDKQSEIVSAYKILPIVCYESVFSDFVAKNAINTQGIFLLASENFMNNSYFGKTQYLNIVRLRAIENKTSILKCSTDGISCVIDGKGNIAKRINTKISNVTMQLNDKSSVYQKIISQL